MPDATPDVPSDVTPGVPGDAPPAPRRTYLDGSSLEPLHPSARATLLAALDQGWADPRRLHREGLAARRLLDNARAATAEALGVPTEAVRFTGSGTEASQLGLLGLVRARPRGGVVAHPVVEHAAVRQAAAWAAEQWSGDRAGVPLVTGVDATGRADAAELQAAASRPGVATVALQSANHEVGTRQPVDDLDLPDDVPLFVDAAVSAGRLPLPDQWTTAAATGSQWGGPAGVGVLLVRPGARWLPPFPGDDERAADGIDRVPAALATAAALQSLVAEAPTLAQRHRAWIDRIRAAAATVPETEVVGDPVDRVPQLVTFSCLYAPGDELVRAFDRRGLAVASGSACTASSLEPSYVLAAMGALTHGNVRLGLTRATTEEDVDAFCAALPEAVAEARAVVGR